MITILQGDVIEQLRTLPNESVHCCVTSPPYWGLRDYGTAQWEGGEDDCDHAEPPRGGRNPETAGKQLTNAGTLVYQFAQDCGKCGAKRIDSQLGLEKTPEQYVAKMVEVFREVRRVLRKDGTCWVNMGDAYNSPNTHTGKADKVDWGLQRVLDAKANAWIGNKNLKPKDLLGMPWRVAFALQADGWWLRSDIIWAKPNPMPESVTDRPTKAHEYLFLLTKASSYFYDAEAIKEQGEGRLDRGRGSNGRIGKQGWSLAPLDEPNGRNKRSVWTVATAPYPEAHFATYPPDLIKPCILAGTSAKGCCAKCGSPWERIVEVSYSNWADGNNNGRRKGEIPKERMTFASGKRCDKDTRTVNWKSSCDCSSTDLLGNKFCKPIIPCTVLDPFAGSGTTGAVALELGRKAILIELNPKYVELIERRCSVTMGLPLAV